MFYLKKNRPGTEARRRRKDCSLPGGGTVTGTGSALPDAQRLLKLSFYKLQVSYTHPMHSAARMIDEGVHAMQCNEKSVRAGLS